MEACFSIISGETALDSKFLDSAIECELIELKRVFKGGGVIMG